MEFVDDYFSFITSVLVMALFGFLLIRTTIKSNLIALSIILFKFGIFFLYFAYFSKYTPILLSDDYNYFHESMGVFYKGEQKISYLLTERGHYEMIVAANGRHYGYYIFNYISFVLFGPYYYSPVLLSVFVTLISGVVVFKTLELVNFSKLFLITFFIFFTCHWDNIAWSSFINLKDNLVALLMVTTLYIFVYFKQKGFSIWKFGLLIVILFIFQFIRFYYSYFLVTTGVVYLIVNLFAQIKSNITDYILKFAILVLLPVIFYVAFISLYSGIIDKIGGRTNVILGSIRYFVTPIPFNLDPSYYFLFLPSILHWLFLPILPVGLYYFMRRYFYELMPFLVIFIMICVFYGSFDELQGPRHRVPQVVFISLIQAISITEIIRVFREKSNLLLYRSNAPI